MFSKRLKEFLFWVFLLIILNIVLNIFVNYLRDFGFDMITIYVILLLLSFLLYYYKNIIFIVF